MVATVMVSWVWTKMVKTLWLNPNRLERVLREQGLQANPYKFWVGDLEEIVKMPEETSSKPMMSLSHDLCPRLFPFVLHMLHKFGKNSFLWYGPTPGLVITSPEVFKDVFNKSYDFTKGRLSPLSKYVALGIVKYDGDKWAKHRKIISPAFTLDKLKVTTYVVGLREYDQNKQLRNLCERLVVDMSREGERAFYFIQGHLEQLSFSRKQEFHPGSAHFNLPSQILCRVINIQLLVEPSANEIYFRITLLPDIDTNPTVPDPAPPEIQKHEMHSFWKILTASITSIHGVSDRQQSPIPSSAIPSQSTHIGVLATASHAVMSGTMFVVYYKQGASQFVIRLNKYLEAMDNNIHVGMRFKMGFQREDSLDEISFFGTFVGIGDFSPEWSGSKWRSLQVQWDEPATIPRPEKVSPWEIEPLATFKSKSFKPNHNPSSVSTSNSPTSLPGNSNNNSRMQMDGIRPGSPLWNESLSFLSELGKDKAGLNDYSSFLSEPEKDKASTSALASFCNWFCCCFQ